MKNRNFNLLRWFAVLSPLLIGLIAICNAWLISTFLNSQLFQREAEISRDFIQNILQSEDSIGYFSHTEDKKLGEKFAGSVRHLSNMQDVLRINIYTKQRIVLWSTDATLIGRNFGDNEELDETLQGELVINGGDITSAMEKEEHIGLDKSAAFYVEMYMPVIDPANQQVVGAVELYKAPAALTRAITQGRQQVALSAIGSALALYLTLYGLIRRADRIIKEQRGRLMEAETLAVVGELTTAVAHNIRNPLSSIRASAELLRDFPQDDGGENAGDIIREVDRISARITELLRLSGKGAQHIERLNLLPLLRECIDDHRGTFAQHGQALRLTDSDRDFWVNADRTLLLQVFISLFSNASEAMPNGGECLVSLSAPAPGKLAIAISDEGGGIPADLAEQILRPFFTTKPKGLGLGLPLAKRIIERFGGTLDLAGKPGKGTTVNIILPESKA